MKIEEWIEGFDLPVILHTRSDAHGVIEWYWKDQVKQFYESWEPNKSDVVIKTKLDKETKKAVHDELWEDLNKKFMAERKEKRIREVMNKNNLNYDDATKLVEKRYHTGYYKKL